MVEILTCARYYDTRQQPAKPSIRLFGRPRSKRGGQELVENVYLII
jgi:hypothetical protein